MIRFGYPIEIDASVNLYIQVSFSSGANLNGYWIMPLNEEISVFESDGHRICIACSSGFAKAH